MSHILDDFIFFGLPNAGQCNTALWSLLALANSLNIPVRHGKTVLSCIMVSLHGIEIDTELMQMRLPLDKLLDARANINSSYQRKKVTFRDLQSLIGTLNFACKVIVPGRTFLRRLINLTVGVANPNHLIRLTVEARLDLAAWNFFLDQFNGKSLCLVDDWFSLDCIRLYSRPCGFVFSAIHGKRWV